MVVHVIDAEFRARETFCEVAERHAVLAAVTRLDVGQALDVQGDGRQHLHLVGEFVRQSDEITACRCDVRAREVDAATVDDRLFPLDLVEGVEAEGVGQADGDRGHGHRQQAFLDLGTRATECRNVDRVDRVDAVLDERALTPASDLAAEPDVDRCLVLANVKGAIDEGVEEFDAGCLGIVVEAAIGELLVRQIGIRRVAVRSFAVGKFLVVPVLATQEDAEVALAELEVVHALEDQ